MLGGDPRHVGECVRVEATPRLAGGSEYHSLYRHSARLVLSLVCLTSTTGGRGAQWRRDSDSSTPRRDSAPTLASLSALWACPFIWGLSFEMRSIGHSHAGCIYQMTLGFHRSSRKLAPRTKVRTPRRPPLTFPRGGWISLLYAGACDLGFC